MDHKERLRTDFVDDCGWNPHIDKIITEVQKLIMDCLRGANGAISLPIFVESRFLALATQTGEVGLTHRMDLSGVGSADLH